MGAIKIEFDKTFVRNFCDVKRIKRNDRYNRNFIITEGVYFADNYWDFTKYNVEKRSDTNYKFDFTRIPQEYIEEVKILILNRFIISKNEFTTVHKLYDLCRTFLSQFYSRGIIDSRMITEEVIKDYIEEKEKSCEYMYIETLTGALKKYIVVSKENEYNKERIVKFLDEKCKEYRKHRPVTAINQYIPDDFHNKVISLAIIDSGNKKYTKEYRIFCCLLVIMAETGMRAEEVVQLQRKKLISIKVKQGIAHFLEFLTFKNGGHKGRRTFCYMTELAAFAYKRAESLLNDIIKNLNNKNRYKLYEEVVKDFHLNIDIHKYDETNFLHYIEKDKLKEVELLASKYLFISSRTGKKILNTDNLREYMCRFSVNNYEELAQLDLEPNEKEDLNYFTINSVSRYEKLCSKEIKDKYSFQDIEKIKFPYVNFHRFRVTLCTRLFIKKVPMDYILKQMNHLYEDMSNYYNKSENFVDHLKENVEILKSITDYDGTLKVDKDNIDLEDIKSVEENIERINIFLKKNKLNIIKDMKKIMMILERTNGTIAENEFGICIRNLVNGLCKKKEHFSSIDDNYHIGVTLESFKYIDFSYERFKQKEEIVRHNKKIALNKIELKFDADREEKALIYFLNKTLVKEIELLESEIKKVGIESVLCNYPYLESIIHRLDDIKGEVNKWLWT